MPLLVGGTVVHEEHRHRARSGGQTAAGLTGGGNSAHGHADRETPAVRHWKFLWLAARLGERDGNSFFTRFAAVAFWGSSPLAVVLSLDLLFVLSRNR